MTVRRRTAAIVASGCAALVLGVALSFSATRADKPATLPVASTPAVPVVAAAVKSGDVPIYLHGIGPVEAALKSAGEIGFTVVSMTVSLIAVFIPLFLMSGYGGLLFREFAVAVSVSDPFSDHCADPDADDVRAPSETRARGAARAF